MAEVYLDKVSKWFGKNREVGAVNDISLRIKDKEFFVLLGPSGSGKSTLLNIIAGLEEPDGGKIFFDGKDVTDIPPEKRNVAMVFQTYALYPHMNVFENISFCLKIKKAPKDEIRRKVEEVTQLLRIGHLLNRMPYELSGGERQRVALARAIVRDPVVYLLDEPLSNIDAKLRVYARAELTRLQRELGITTIFVTHDQVEAMTMADRIGLIEKGKIVQVGKPSDLFNHPVNTFVAGFMGSPPMNLIDISVKESKEGVLIEVAGKQLKILKEFEQIVKGQKTSEIILGIRPEHISVHEKQESEEDIEMEIFAVENLGSESLLNLTNPNMGDTAIKVRLPYTFEKKEAKKVWVQLDRENMYFFNKDGENILKSSYGTDEKYVEVK
jgi:multiple sugar transport system ATP-binding protein